MEVFFKFFLFFHRSPFGQQVYRKEDQRTAEKFHHRQALTQEQNTADNAGDRFKHTQDRRSRGAGVLDAHLQKGVGTHRDRNGNDDRIDPGKRRKAEGEAAGKKSIDSGVNREYG